MVPTRPGDSLGGLGGEDSTVEQRGGPRRQRGCGHREVAVAARRPVGACEIARLVGASRVEVPDRSRAVRGRLAVPERGFGPMPVDREDLVDQVGAIVAGYRLEDEGEQGVAGVRVTA